MTARYDFGRNWAALAAQLGEEHVERACEDLRRLVGDIAGRSFLDIGCGSGLHSVAALRLGAERVLAVDYDSRCVEVARTTLRRFVPAGGWKVRRADVRTPASLPTGPFDIVYAWGVLHHTGDMWAAIRNSAALTAPGGCLAVALYRRTLFCAIWRLEKRLYVSQGWLRPAIKACFTAAPLLARTVRHGDAPSFVRNYRRARHGVHDRCRRLAGRLSFRFGGAGEARGASGRTRLSPEAQLQHAAPAGPARDRMR
jgi:2-polyprenyl-6-hydroxyphenyl methylase/3-demethylubiquinone-9 3-methyltransferase